MPCYKPLSAFHTYNSVDSSRSIVFGRERLRSDGNYVDLPCGQCIGCRLEKSRRWAVRIMHEASLHDANSFITLTYSNDKLPADGSLRLEDYQAFMKRLRRGSSGPLRFFHCGEYGETTGRPHYHACLFGEDFLADRVPYKVTSQGHTLWTSERLTKTWGLGHAIIGDLTFETAAYTARYVLKKITGERKSEHYHEYCDLESRVTGYAKLPEYVTMSRRPGIGRGWFDKYSSEVYPSDSVVMRGVEMLPPPAYDRLLKQADPELFERVKAERSHAAKALNSSNDSRTSRLIVREKVKTETIKNTLKRDV